MPVSGRFTAGQNGLREIHRRAVAERGRQDFDQILDGAQDRQRTTQRSGRAIQQVQAPTRPLVVGDVGEHRRHTHRIAVGFLQPERLDGHDPAASRVVQGTHGRAETDQGDPAVHDLPQPVVDDPCVLGPQEVGQAPAAQVGGHPGVRQQVRVRPQQAQVRIEDGQPHSALQEQFLREGVVLPPSGDQLQGRAEYEAAGRVPTCAVVQRDDAEADLQLAS